MNRKYAIIFITLSLICAFYVITAPSVLVRLLAASTAVAFAGVGSAYAFLGPKAFFKKPDGRLHLVSYLVFWPYHLLNTISLLGLRLTSKEKPFDCVDENVYLGRRLYHSDEAAFTQLKVCSVLDLTCEFSEMPALRRLAYRSIPILDMCAPTVEQAEAGAQWINKQKGHGPVYIHCALGHGRSATFVAAYLLLSGKAQTAKEAVAFISTIRPRVGLTKSQWALLRKLETVSLP